MGQHLPRSLVVFPMSHASLNSDSGAKATDATSASLIERVRAQSPEAWRTLATLYSPLIYRWCRRMGISSSEAADVSQEVFRAVARQVGQFRHSREAGDSFRGWLYTITQNKARDQLRRRRGQPQAAGGTDAQIQLANHAADADPLYGDSGPPADDKSLLAMQLLDQLRGEFGPSALTAFWRMVVDGHAAADIARDLAITPKAVRQAKFRVLQRLRKELKELEVGD